MNQLPLEPHQAHIWRVHLLDVLGQLESLQSILSPAQLERANRYLFQRDHHRFIVGQGILQTLCGRYLAIEPASVRFTYNAYGKPGLERDELYFNLSHSGEWLIYAFARVPLVGIDLEQIRPIERVGDLVKDYFAPGERAAFAALPIAEQIPAFFRVWTRKEAYIKAVGVGMSLPLPSFEVSLDTPAQLLHSDHACQLYEVEVAAGYIACLAISPMVSQIEYLRY